MGLKMGTLRIRNKYSCSVGGIIALNSRLGGIHRNFPQAGCHFPMYSTGGAGLPLAQPKCISTNEKTGSVDRRLGQITLRSRWKSLCTLLQKTCIPFPGPLNTDNITVYGILTFSLIIYISGKSMPPLLLTKQMGVIYILSPQWVRGGG